MDTAVDLSDSDHPGFAIGTTIVDHDLCAFEIEPASRLERNPVRGAIACRLGVVPFKSTTARYEFT